jgi:hypothetical protein
VKEHAKIKKWVNKSRIFSSVYIFLHDSLIKYSNYTVLFCISEMSPHETVIFCCHAATTLYIIERQLTRIDKVWNFMRLPFFFLYVLSFIHYIVISLHFFRSSLDIKLSSSSAQ